MRDKAQTAVAVEDGDGGAPTSRWWRRADCAGHQRLQSETVVVVVVVVARGVTFAAAAAAAAGQ